MGPQRRIMSHPKIIILLLAISAIVNAETINPINTDPKTHHCQKAPGNWIGNGQSTILGYMTCALSNIIWDVLEDGNGTYILIRRTFGGNQCVCDNETSCSGGEAIWVGTCTEESYGGVIRATGFSKEYIDGQVKLKLMDLYGIVNDSNRMDLRLSNDIIEDLYTVHKE